MTHPVTQKFSGQTIYQPIELFSGQGSCLDYKWNVPANSPALHSLELIGLSDEPIVYRWSID